MIALIQRVTQAQVEIDSQIVGKINHGILALIGVERQDDQAVADKLLKKICTYRIFSDAQGKMNRSLLDIGGELLLVSQFTLVADTNKGTRPGFSKGATPQQGEQLFEYMVEQARQTTNLKIQTGRFAADMQITLTNDGPVTFHLVAR